MSTAILDEPTIRLPDGYPFHIGYRHVRTVDAAGVESWETIPLTEEDFLHPQEGDHFVATLDHSLTVQQLVHAIGFAGRGRALMALFNELRIDWQVPGVRPHQPDVVAFDRLPEGLPPTTATLTVIDHDVAPLAVFEVTSPETRHVDLDDKFEEYRRAGVPVYLVIDLAAPNGVPALLAFALHDGQYREMDEDPTLGYWVPGVDLWFRLQNHQLVVAERDGGDIPTSAESGRLMEGLTDEVERVRSEAEAEAARAEAEAARAEAAEKLAAEQKARADAEKATAQAEAARADAEKARADAEKARADAVQQQMDAVARELAELKARLASNG